jgi:TPR repeat protein
MKTAMVSPKIRPRLSNGIFSGEGVIKDKSKAVQWFTKAAEQGNAQAQYNLGVCYLYGEGVIKDKSKAVQWFTKAAEQGDARAQYNLALCYAKGKGVVRDKAKASLWYTKAVKQGFSGVQSILERLSMRRGKKWRLD